MVMPSSRSQTVGAGGGGGPSALAAASAHGLPRLAHASVVEGSCPFESGLCRHPGWARQKYPTPTPATISDCASGVAQWAAQGQVDQGAAALSRACPATLSDT